ncbi:DUF4266 domain-containing protein [Aquimarina sp. 2-A2]|uniref:DUF4266 domain-containing protein n=1 Tax=Aquimarina sp. 2-A2 TaxID=3382644 RepID=UPI00387F3795
MRLKGITISLVFVTIIQSCATVKEYEKVAINDPDMELNTKKTDRFQINFQAYREAAAGANGGKTGGGCGCN